MSAFLGGTDPSTTDEWRLKLEGFFRSLQCLKVYQMDMSVHYLAGEAHLWWRGVSARREPCEALDQMESLFLALTQRNRVSKLLVTRCFR